MSEETTTAEISGAPAPQEPVSQTPETSVDSMMDLAIGRDVKGVREAFDRLISQVPKDDDRREPESNEPDPQPVAKDMPEVKPEVKPEPTPEVQSKKFALNDDLEIDDSDGHLGYKSLDALKKAAANQILHIKNQKKWLAETESQARAERERALTLETELKQVKEQLAKGAPAPAQTQQPQVQAPSFEFAGLPPRPNVPFEPSLWSDADAKAMADWEVSKSQAYENGMKSLKTYADQIALSTISKLDDNNPLKQELNALKAEFQKTQKDFDLKREALEREQQDTRWWKDREEFQRLHDELKTPLPLGQLHKQIAENGRDMVWMDYVAKSNGLQRPLDNDPGNWEKYYRDRGIVTQRYLDGDKAVVDNCAKRGVEPPNGYREYFDVAAKINELDGEHRRLIDNGILGAKSSIQDAWEYSNRNNLSRQVVTMERKARADGANDILDALQTKERETAVTIPPHMTQIGDTPITPDKLQEMMEQARLKARDPASRKMMKELTEAMAGLS